MSDSANTVVVIGGGPAGIAAAACVAENGASTVLIDDNPRLGGQIWRSGGKIPQAKEAGHWLNRFMRSGAKLQCGTRIVDRLGTKSLLAESDRGIQRVDYSQLILATGARERLLPFPGWTIPNVVAAGGLQALVKGGARIAGKRVAIAGSGPLLLAVATYLRLQGAVIVLIAEQAPWSRLVRFSAKLKSSPHKLWQAILMGVHLRGVRFKSSCWPIAARGESVLEQVEFQSKQGRFSVACDYLACGFGLIPNLELPRLIGCEVHNGFVAVDEWQQTSIDDVYCAGEPTGIGGIDSALCAGQIAGFATVGRKEKARGLFPARTRGKKFEETLAFTFALRPELRQLCQPETVVCRCEDVTYERLQPMTSWREAKLQTRCGMGACQGRTCGAVAEFLWHWQLASARPPVFPARVESLAGKTLTLEK